MGHLHKVELSGGRGHHQAHRFGLSVQCAVNKGGEFLLNHQVQLGLLFVLSYPRGHEHGQSMPKRNAGVEASHAKFCCDGERVSFCHPT